MTDVAPDEWSKENQEYLVECINQVKTTLHDHVGMTKVIDAYIAKLLPGEKPRWNNKSSPPAIDHLCTIFGLSDFERSILLLCAAAELDSEVPTLCAKAQGNPAAAYPTFSLALAALPDAHWSALTPASPLRRFKLIGLYGSPQMPITKCQLQIEERILHYLTGISYLDQSLRGLMESIRAGAPLSESQKKTGELILQEWKQGKRLFSFQLTGSDETSKKIVANWVCNQLGLQLWQMPSELIPSKPEDVESLAQLWTRESVLFNAGLYISSPEIEPATQKTVKRFAERLDCAVFLSTTEQWPSLNRPTISLEVSKPTKPEQRNFWKSLLGGAVPAENADQLDLEILKVVNQFNLNASSIESAALDATFAISRGEDLSSALWSASRKVARPRLSELAQLVVPKAKMDDLVLPEREKELLRSIIANVRQRYRVYEEWGFSKGSDRGLGITALFSGVSGTGKTMAAEVLADELKLDLFKIDLSMVVNKYVGETEKNLRKIFDAAEDGGAVLFFDEADALFGKRSEVRDSHDRYANIEIGYLLQRMEAYRGLAILTTNMKNAIDTAFMRRIRFVVNFPFPDEKSRKEIWRKVFPPSVPINKLNFDLLAQLDVTGGHIRNIALGASFLAAEEGIPVNMNHINRAAKEEYNKMERPMPNAKFVRE
ncbi:MAG: ATP-binding protein [Thaumarchaeota archaeon]|nr:ATP-binding protein [Nitrososphaerota archaeon]MCL5317212.1 ATP-binding protein [Nitrososphaerota archaeon]